MFFGELSATESILLTLHPLLVLASWIYLYSSRKPSRDMLFWGMWAFVLPYIGPLTMLLYFARKRGNHMIGGQRSA